MGIGNLENLKKLFLLLAIVSLFSAGAVASVPVYADDEDEDDKKEKETSCSGFISLGTFKKIIVDGTFCTLSPNVTVKGDIEVKNGGSLTTSGTTVNGDIKVKNGGSISIFSTTVKKDIKVEGATDVVIFGGTVVGKNVKIEHVSGISAVIILLDVTVNGNVEIKKSQVALNAIVVSTIKGDVKFKDNTVTDPFYGNVIGGNTIGGELDCDKNFPLPNNKSFGGPNSVAQDKKHQCKAL